MEWQINLAPFEDLLRMVSREQIQFTGKCVLKLMQLSIAELDQCCELSMRNGELIAGTCDTESLSRSGWLSGADGTGQVIREQNDCQKLKDATGLSRGVSRLLLLEKCNQYIDAMGLSHGASRFVDITR